MKYLRFILLFAFLNYSGVSAAQLTKESVVFLLTKNKADSLKSLIAGAPDDTTKVKRLLLLSGLQIGLEKATTGFALQALSIAEKLQFKPGIASANYAIGGCYQNNSDYQTAIKYFKLALDQSEMYPTYLKKEDFYPALLNLYFYLGDYPNAMETISREMAIAEKTNDKRRIAHCNNILGYIYFKQENFVAAEKYYNLYINNAKELEESGLLAHALGEVADVYIREGKYTQAINSLFTTIQICDHLLVNPDTRNTNQTLSMVPQYKAKALYRLGKAYKLTGELSKALQYSLGAVKFNTKSKYENASYYINAGDVYKELKEFKKAIEYLSYGFNLSKEIRHRENTRDAAEYLSQTYALQHQYDSAFYFYRLFTGLKDSIVNNETKMKIAGIQGQYDVAKKDKEIFRQWQVKNVLIGSFILLLILLFFLYNRYRLRQNNRYQKELNRQQNELFNAISVTQDQERKRIAEDIHDSLGSILSAAKLKLSALKEGQTLLSDGEAENWQITLQLLDEASSELRNISHNIMPATLSKLGLVAALKNLISNISSHSGMQISFSAHDFTERIDEKTEMSIYRMVLELINNIVKHAQATKVTVQLIKYPDYINLSVEDNGRGFDYGSALQEKKGIGLGNILSRVDYLRGKMNVDSVPGRGTTVIIDVPLSKEGI